MTGPQRRNTVDSQKYVVEKIVGKRIVRGRLQFRVKWMNYPMKASTWEPVEALGHLSRLLADYEARQYKRFRKKLAKAAKGPKSRAKSKAKGAARRRQSRHVPSAQAVTSATSGSAAAGQGANGERGSLIGSKEQSSGSSVVARGVGRAHERKRVDPLAVEQPRIEGVQHTSPSRGTSAQVPDWKMEPYRESFGLARGLELEMVHHCYFVRRQLFMFVTWVGHPTMDAVLLSDIRQAYPMPIIKYFESLAFPNYKDA
ncbi:chromo domain-containing protein LHP1-like [Drosophila sechellia]|uniref:HP1D2 n=1 Tax=Drosophila sechellia TaxID=7238 RepID=A0A142I113_DROSE|nr:chromo domain-containing protein LHP1-like [Drosophila sechellia]AMR36244.1 HP1D2 [Drosophila sechellia]